MTSRETTRHGGVRVVRASVPDRAYLVHVVRGSFNRSMSAVVVGETIRPLRSAWLVWCPCCREWSAVATFRDACDVVADILPGVRR